MYTGRVEGEKVVGEIVQCMKLYVSLGYTSS